MEGENNSRESLSPVDDHFSGTRQSSSGSRPNESSHSVGLSELSSFISGLSLQTSSDTDQRRGITGTSGILRPPNRSDSNSNAGSPSHSQASFVSGSYSNVRRSVDSVVSRPGYAGSVLSYDNAIKDSIRASMHRMYSDILTSVSGLSTISDNGVPLTPINTPIPSNIKMNRPLDSSSRSGLPPKNANGSIDFEMLSHKLLSTPVRYGENEGGQDSQEPRGDVSMRNVTVDFSTLSPPIPTLDRAPSAQKLYIAGPNRSSDVPTRELVEHDAQSLGRSNYGTSEEHLSPSGIQQNIQKILQSSGESLRDSQFEDLVQSPLSNTTLNPVHHSTFIEDDHQATTSSRPLSLRISSRSGLLPKNSNGSLDFERLSHQLLGTPGSYSENEGGQDSQEPRGDVSMRKFTVDFSALPPSIPALDRAPTAQKLEIAGPNRSSDVPTREHPSQSVSAQSGPCMSHSCLNSDQSRRETDDSEISLPSAAREMLDASYMSIVRGSSGQQQASSSYSRGTNQSRKESDEVLLPLEARDLLERSQMALQQSTSNRSNSHSAPGRSTAKVTLSSGQQGNSISDSGIQMTINETRQQPRQNLSLSESVGNQPAHSSTMISDRNRLMAVPQLPSPIQIPGFRPMPVYQTRFDIPDGNVNENQMKFLLEDARAYEIALAEWEAEARDFVARTIVEQQAPGSVEAGVSSTPSCLITGNYSLLTPAGSSQGLHVPNTPVTPEGAPTVPQYDLHSRSRGYAPNAPEWVYRTPTNPGRSNYTTSEELLTPCEIQQNLQGILPSSEESLRASQSEDVVQSPLSSTSNFPVHHPAIIEDDHPSTSFSRPQSLCMIQSPLTPACSNMAPTPSDALDGPWMRKDHVTSIARAENSSSAHTSVRNSAPVSRQCSKQSSVTLSPSLREFVNPQYYNIQNSSAKTYTRPNAPAPSNRNNDRKVSDLSLPPAAREYLEREYIPLSHGTIPRPPSSEPCRRTDKTHARNQSHPQIHSCCYSPQRNYPFSYKSSEVEQWIDWRRCHLDTIFGRYFRVDDPRGRIMGDEPLDRLAYERMNDYCLSRVRTQNEQIRILESKLLNGVTRIGRIENQLENSAIINEELKSVVSGLKMKFTQSSKNSQSIDDLMKELLHIDKKVSELRKLFADSNIGRF